MSMVSSSSAGGARGSFIQSNPSTEAASHVPKKRPRPVLSCIECRNKKLKCDRILPCNQCTRLDRTAQCVYQSREASQARPEAVSDGSESELGPCRKKTSGAQQVLQLTPRDRVPDRVHIPLTGNTEKSEALEELQSRVEKLERILSANSQPHPHPVSRTHSGPPPVASSDYVESVKWSSANHQGILSLKGKRMRYFGPNHKLALLNRFENAMNFCQRGFPGLSSMMSEFKILQKTISAKRKAIKNIPNLDSATAFSKIVELLPPRTVCDHLVATYFYNGEKSLRIIHLPSFLHECQQFWENQTPPVTPYHGFVPQLYAVMVVGSCWDQSNALSKHLASHAVNEAAVSKMIESWLAGLDWKRRVDLSTLRTQCLIYMTHQLHSTASMETVWTNAGKAVRMAMTMGLHRDPNEFPNISIFEGEQRRRLWATVVEMDLQTSLLSGCPALVRYGEYNCMPPANVDDLQLYEEMTEYPVAKPLDEWSDSILQILLANSFPLRLQAVSAASRIQGKPDYRSLLELGSKIEEYLEDLPAHAKFGRAVLGGPGRQVGQMILNKYIRRVLVCLYRPFILGAADDDVFLEGRRACIRNSLALLNQQDFWDPDVADLKTVNSRMYWDVFHTIAKTDIMQAALSVCLEIKALSEVSSHEELARRETAQSPIVWRNPPISQWTKVSLTRTVENTLNSLLRRLDDPNTDLRDALALSMALQSARLAGEQDATDSLMITGATTVIKACRLHFYGFDSAGIGLEKQQDTDPSPLPVPTTPASLGETRELTFADGPLNTYDGMSFPLESDMGMGLFDLDLDIDWDWGEAWG